jgi:hypothetical protein
MRDLTFDTRRVLWIIFHGNIFYYHLNYLLSLSISLQWNECIIKKNNREKWKVWPEENFNSKKSPHITRRGGIRLRHTQIYLQSRQNGWQIAIMLRDISTSIFKSECEYIICLLFYSFFLLNIKSIHLSRMWWRKALLNCFDQLVQHTSMRLLMC